MAFLNPLLLLGIAGIASPIIIHLLAKKQIKRVVWAAMRFLKVTVDRNQRKMNLEDLLLLLLRCLILAVLALALARPALREGGIGLLDGDEASLILLDNSGSMSASDGAATRFEKAQKAANQILDGLPGGSRVGVWLISDTVRDSIPEPTRDFALARKIIREAKQSDQGTEWQPAMRRAIDVLGRQTGMHKHIYVVTDGQAVGWRGVGETRKSLESVKKEMNATLVLVGEGEQRNLGVTDVRLASALAPVNQPLRFEVSVANFGTEEVRNVAVSLGIDEDAPTDEQTIEVLPAGGEPKVISLFATFREPGFHTVTARLHPDRCTFDDQRTLALRVMDEVNVLLVDGDPGAEPRDSEVFYLRNALTPVPLELRGRFFIKTRTVTGVEFDKIALRDFEVVVLANVVDLSVMAADSLHSFVRQGGGLLVFPGSRISLPFYNERLFADRGLLPAAFGEPIGEAVDETKAERPQNYFHLQSKDYAHRIVDLWKDPASGSLALAQFYRALTLVPGKKSDVPGDAPAPAVVLSYSGGQPAVMERSYGFGRVVQFSSTADGAWNDLPVRPVFLPLIHRTLGFLLARYEERLNVRAGTPFTFAAAADRVGKDYVVVEPNAKKESARPKAVVMKGSLPQVEQADTSLAGAYSVSFLEDSEGNLRFAAASDPAEGDLHELSAADIATLAPVAQVIRWTPATDLRDRMQRERTGTELWFLLALAAVVLVVVDTIMGNRFSRPK
jgi:hypothetical protein